VGDRLTVAFVVVWVVLFGLPALLIVVLDALPLVGDWLTAHVPFWDEGHRLLRLALVARVVVDTFRSPVARTHVHAHECNQLVVPLPSGRMGVCGSQRTSAGSLNASRETQSHPEILGGHIHPM
jgi:hypothetical protein